MAELGAGAAGGAHRIVDRLLRVAAGCTLEEMMGELGEMALEAPRVGRVERLERLADAPVQSRSLRGAELFIEGLANEGVGEAEGSLGRLGEKLRRHCARELVAEHRRLGADHLGQRLEVKLP